MTWCYNSWWTLPERFDSDKLVALASQWKQRLFQRHGAFFDVLAIDAGWSALESLWEIDRRAFADGFGPVRRLVESAGGRLGLWISPSSIYVIAVSHEWARRTGLTITSKRETWGEDTLGISLADPAYRLKTQETLCRLIRENHIAHIKFDGLIPFEDKPHHELLPGPDSIEPLAAHAVALMTAAKQCDPSLVTEPTFLNSWSNYISPWILKYSDTVYGNAGGDYPRGVGPAPDYRESCTNAREWYIFSSFNEVWLPQNALQYFDIVHCDEAAGFVNHAAMAVVRGRFFIPVYVNPKFLSDDDMAALAGLMRLVEGQSGGSLPHDRPAVARGTRRALRVCPLARPARDRCHPQPEQRVAIVCPGPAGRRALPTLPMPFAIRNTRIAVGWPQV